MHGTDRWRNFLVATMGAGALWGLAWLGLHEPRAADSAEPTSSARGTSRAKGSSRTDDGGPCAFSPGERMAYEVTTRTRAALDLTPLSDDVKVAGGGMQTQTTAPQARQATRRWQLDMRAIARTDDGSSVLVARVVDGGTLSDDGTSAPADPALAEPFLVRLDPRCGIHEFGWRTEGDLAAARQQQALVAALGFWAPEHDAPRGAEGFDALGRYRAVYQARAGGAIEGRIEAYAEPFAQARSPVAPTLTVQRSSLVVEPGAGEWFVSLASERAVAMAVHGEPIGTMHTRVEARRIAAGPWAPEVALRDGGWSWGLLLGLEGERIAAPIDQALVGLAAQDAVDRYLAMIHGRQSTAQYAGFLSEWLRANPAGASALVAMLQAGAFDAEDRARSALFYALGTADTPEATAALLGLVGGEDSALAHRISAAHALAAVEHPPPEVVEVLAEQAGRSDIHPAARGSLAMALGTFAHRSDGRDPALAQQARARIEGWLEAPADVEALSGSLLAAGNAGHDDLAGAIAPYLDHDQPRIRQQAAHALRQMSPEQAFPRLASGLHDGDRGVRVKVLASATEVSRSHGVLPPSSMIETAAGWLGESNDRSEERALIALLGEAAQRGSDQARGVLQDRLAQELAREQRDPDRLRALGAFADNRWQAD